MEFEKIHISNGWIIFVEDFFSKKEADFYFQTFLENLNWESSNIKIFGKTYQTPRLEAFHSENDLSYSYSGKKLTMNPFTKELAEIKSRLKSEFEIELNCVLANMYRNGNDSNGWHSDNEKELGKNPIIVSLTFGQTRRFDLKHNQNVEKLSFSLQHGSLLIMGGEMQHFWKHQIAKSKQVEKPRINLTFRKISNNL